MVFWSTRRKDGKTEMVEGSRVRPEHDLKGVMVKIVKDVSDEVQEAKKCSCVFVCARSVMG